MTITLKKALTVAALSIATASFAPAAFAADITGAGATFPYPIYAKWAEAYKAKLNASGAFPSPVVTEISAASAFYIAEKYHQNYYNENGDQPYCSLVIRPKLEKFKKVFSEKLTK